MTDDPPPPLPPQVAVKVIHVSDDTVDGKKRQVALKEAAICCALHHPNIVTTYTAQLQPWKRTKAARTGEGSLQAGQGTGCRV